MNLSDYVQLVSVPSSTPGVQTQQLKIADNAPKEVQDAIAFANRVGGDYSYTPQQLYNLASQRLSSTTGQQVSTSDLPQTAATNAKTNQQNAAIAAQEKTSPGSTKGAVPSQQDLTNGLIQGQIGGLGSAMSTLDPTTRQVLAGNVAKTLANSTQPGGSLDFNALTGSATPIGSTGTSNVVGSTSVGSVVAPNPTITTPTLPTVPGASSGSGTGSGVDFGSLVTPSLPATPQGALTLPNVTAPPVTVPNINTTGNPLAYFGNEAGSQTGSYSSTGANAQTQQGQQSTAAAENTHQTGTTATSQQNIGAQTTSGATTGSTTVNTPFDISSLIASELPQIQASDQTRNNFLTDFVNTGGTGFNDQVDKAVRDSLTGPQTTGAGDNARARIAGSAAADVARNNAGQRLQAAQLLGSPTGLGATVQATAPLYGTSTTGTTSGLTSSANTSTGLTSSDLQTAAQKIGQTVDFNQLVGQEAQTGVAGGTSKSASSGVAPQGQQVQQGGCVVCTAYVSMGQMKPGAIRRAVRWKLSQPRYITAVKGYLTYGPTIALLVLRNRTFAKLFYPIARAILYHEVHLSAPTRLRWRVIPFITHEIFDRLSWAVGLFDSRQAGVRNPTVLSLLRRQNLSFPL